MGRSTTTRSTKMSCVGMCLSEHPWGSTSAAVDALFSRTSSGSLELDAGEFRVVKLCGEDHSLLPEVIEVIARSECGTTTTQPDALLDWVYAAREHNVFGPLSTAPDAAREAWFRWLTAYCVHFGLKRGSVYALVDPASRRVVAATVTGPPRAVPFGRMSPEEMGLNCRRAGMALAAEVLLNPRMKSLGMWQANTEETLGMAGNFLYVVMFATAPEWQGRGVGSALLRFLGDVADADGVASYLETAGVRNTTFYARKGGFEEVARSPIGAEGGFGHDGGAVAMRRPPQNSAKSNVARRVNAAQMAADAAAMDTAAKRLDAPRAHSPNTNRLVSSTTPAKSLHDIEGRGVAACLAW